MQMKLADMQCNDTRVHICMKHKRDSSSSSKEGHDGRATDRGLGCDARCVRTAPVIGGKLGGGTPHGCTSARHQATSEAARLTHRARQAVDLHFDVPAGSHCQALGRGISAPVNMWGLEPWAVGGGESQAAERALRRWRL